MRYVVYTLIALTALANAASAAVIQYGDKDVVGTSTYGTDPVTGATLEGLAPGISTVGVLGLDGLDHGFPFSPSPGDYPGTDQIYVGSVQTGSSDGYSVFPGRLNGPHTIVMDYSAAVPVNTVITTLTLGIGFDDFQFPFFGQPYSVSVNGIADPDLTTLANSFNQTGPKTSFASIGIDTSVLNANHVLTLSIDQGGTGGDGWAVDFLTIGVTTAPVPIPPALGLLALGSSALLWRRRRSA